MNIIRLKLTPVILCFLGIFGFARAQSKKINIIYIGDSITYGAFFTDPSKDAPPAKADSVLKSMGIDIVASSNQGHGGFTTLDFLPHTDAFKQIEVVANKFKDNGATILFSIMLGTNDSAMDGPLGAPVSKEHYYENLKAITDQLLMDYPGSIIVINRQTWYSPNTYNGARYLQEGLSRLKSYYPQIKHLVSWYRKNNTGKIYLGDTRGFHYFKANYLTSLRPEDGHQGTFYLHPGKDGARALGAFWAKAIYKSINRN